MSSSKERILSDGRLDFSQRLLENAIGDKPKYDFLSDLLGLVLKYSGCDSVEIWLKESGQALRCEVIRLKITSWPLRYFAVSVSDDFSS